MRSPHGPARAALSLSIAGLVAGLLVATGPGPTQAAGAPGAAAAEVVAPVAAARRTPDERVLDRVRVPRIAWGECEFSVGPPFGARQQCATVQVPLDYDDPDGATTTLAVARLKAAKPGRRIGSLFVNPGGPGGSSADFVLGAALSLGQQAQNRFDIVGVDPRGVGGSGRTVCRGQVTTFPQFAFPVSRGQARTAIDFDDQVRAACRTGATPLVGHASTADVARDMDLVRRAVGDSRLTYYGISYGSYLGSTYAAMFPRHVRALVIDGVLDPVAWSSGNRSRPVALPQTTRLRSGFGSYEALTAALTECDRVGRGRCPIAPDALGTWKRLLAAARAGRLGVGEERLDYQSLVSLALSALYDRRSIPQLTQLLAEIETAVDTATTTAPRGQKGSSRRPVQVVASPAYRHLVAARDDLDRRGLYAAPSLTPRASAPVPVDVQFPAVLCSDGRNPQPGVRWDKTAARDDKRTPWFGRLWTWSSSTCAKGGIGSSADAFRGPWRTRTSYPLLVVGNTHDPATPFSGARRAHSLFPDSSLVTYDAWGHGALGGGKCITTLMTDYLVDRRLPADGTVCRQPKPLYR